MTILAAGQRALAGRFAAGGRPGARLMLDGVPHRRGPLSGALIPDGGLAALECQVTRREDAGDHLLVIASVLQVPYLAEAGEPLIRFARPLPGPGPRLTPQLPGAARPSPVPGRPQYEPYAEPGAQLERHNHGRQRVAGRRSRGGHATGQDRHQRGAHGPGAGLLAGRPGQLRRRPARGRRGCGGLPGPGRVGALDQGLPGPDGALPGRRGGDQAVPGHRHRHPHRGQHPLGGPGHRPRRAGALHGQRPGRVRARPGAAVQRPARQHRVLRTPTCATPGRSWPRRPGCWISASRSP